MGSTRLGSFFVMSLSWVTGAQHTSLWVGSGWHIGPSIPLKRESPMTTTLFYVLLGEVVMREVGCHALGTPSIPEEP